MQFNDFVKICESIIFSKNSIGKAYNVTFPAAYDWEEFVKTAAEVVGEKVNIKKINYKNLKIKPREFFPFRDCSLILEIDKLKKDKLYIPEINLKEGLGKCYKWYKKTRPVLLDPGMNKIEYALKNKNSL